MKNYAYLGLVVLILISHVSAAKSLAFSKGSVHMGIGFNWYHNANHAFEYYNNGYTYYTEHLEVEGPGVIFAVDGGIHDMFSLGGDITTFFDETNIWYDNNNYTEDFVWGITPMFRFGFHPFGIPELKGKIPVAKSLDPYVGMRMGTSIAFLTNENNYDYYDDATVDAEFLVTPSIGVRYYFDGGNFGLWAETDFYNFVGAVTFKF